MRLGVIVPSANTVLEPNLYKMAPEISFHFSRISCSMTRRGLARMIHDVPSIAHMLKETRVAVIAFGCTSGSFIGGESYDEDVIRTIERSTNSKGTTASTAVVSALKELDARKITVVSPYETWLNEVLAKILQSKGFEVVSITGLGLVGFEEASATPLEILRVAEKNDSEESDAILISCTNFRAIDIIDRLEKSRKKPVVTSNQAMLWKMLTLTGQDMNPIPGYGELLKRHLSGASK